LYDLSACLSHAACLMMVFAKSVLPSQDCFAHIDREDATIEPAVNMNAWHPVERDNLSVHKYCHVCSNAQRAEDVFKQIWNIATDLAGATPHASALQPATPQPNRQSRAAKPCGKPACPPTCTVSNTPRSIEAGLSPPVRTSLFTTWLTTISHSASEKPIPPKSDVTSDNIAAFSADNNSLQQASLELASCSASSVASALSQPEVIALETQGNFDTNSTNQPNSNPVSTSCGHDSIIHASTRNVCSNKAVTTTGQRVLGCDVDLHPWRWILGTLPSRFGITGLPNPGATCFCAAGIQVLLCHPDVLALALAFPITAATDPVVVELVKLMRQIVHLTRGEEMPTLWAKPLLVAVRATLCKLRPTHCACASSMHIYDGDSGHLF
jgi:hypothetical protein